MKLVELLVKEIEEWPHGVTYFVQDKDGEVKAAGESEPREPREPTSSGVWIRISPLDNYNFYSGLCTDWQTSIVTKDDYTKHKEETQMKQDFCNTKIHIKSEEHSKAIQEAVFAAGWKWQGGGEFYREGINFIFLNDSLRMTYCDNAVFFQEHDYKEIQFPLPTKGHVHAELMAQYAEDAKTTTEPWELWQVKVRGGFWQTCQTCHYPPTWGCELEYRRKPKTHIVNGVEIPDLRVSPEYGDYYYLTDPLSKTFFTSHYFTGHSADKDWVDLGLVYPYTEEGKQASILHAKAMLGIA